LVGSGVGGDVEESGAVGENWVLGEAERAEGAEPLGECETWLGVWEEDAGFVSDASSYDSDV